MKAFFSEEYYADIGRHVIPMGKYRLVKNAMEQTGLPLEVIEPEIISDEDILRVHTNEYLDALKTGVPESLAESCGIKWSPELMKSFFLRASGTYGACKAALEDKVAANLGGGAHHARKEEGSAFCGLNDLAIAIRKLQDENAVERVLVVDCDLHYGDGTAKIFADDDSVFTFSMYGKETWAATVENHTSRAIRLPEGCGKDIYFENLHLEVPKIISEFKPDLIVYNTGADPHKEDPMSNLNMSTEDLAERDRIVFQMAKDAGVPVAYALAGGYNRDVKKVVEIHKNTFLKAMEIFFLIKIRQGLF